MHVDEAGHEVAAFEVVYLAPRVGALFRLGHNRLDRVARRDEHHALEWLHVLRAVEDRAIRVRDSLLLCCAQRMPPLKLKSCGESVANHVRQRGWHDAGLENAPCTYCGPEASSSAPVARGPTRMELTFVARVRDVITDAERKVNRPNTKSVRPYAFIVSFGVVSMLMDVVYRGALAVQGPLLASLGANALVIGIVSGLGEATALGGRLFSGPLADRSGRYWAFAIGGYATTALAVPAMGFVGSLVGVSALVIVERLGNLPMMRSCPRSTPSPWQSTARLPRSSSRRCTAAHKPFSGLGRGKPPPRVSASCARPSSARSSARSRGCSRARPCGKSPTGRCSPRSRTGCSGGGSARTSRA